jgi:DNA-binding XRE family transcriptional regulator
MAKRASGVPSAVRPKGAATPLPDPFEPSSKTIVPPAAKGGSARSPGATAADDFPFELHIIFGENLRVARLQRGLNQREVAARTGLPQQYLSQIELGQQNVTLKTVELLAKVVDRDPSTMLRRPRHTSPKK